MMNRHIRLFRGCTPADESPPTPRQRTPWRTPRPPRRSLAIQGSVPRLLGPSTRDHRIRNVLSARAGLSASRPVEFSLIQLARAFIRSFGLLLLRHLRPPLSGHSTLSQPSAPATASSAHKLLLRPGASRDSGDNPQPARRSSGRGLRASHRYLPGPGIHLRSAPAAAGSPRRAALTASRTPEVRAQRGSR